MNKILFSSLVALLLVCGCSQPKYNYQTFENDPSNTMIYTLKNGLKVYMSVVEDQPRVQTLIGVNVGAKNDPSHSTGLAHYFEHLMFKGTEKFGTIDYKNEKPLLDSIEHKFEIYRTLTSEKSRDSLYHIIDSISYLASRYSVPNEYDKLMNVIGAKGTNAWTSYDQTVFTEDIPSNQIENWAKIQADRFHNPVIRLFHTELETVYEEKNMSLTSDIRRVIEAINQSLFSRHPYGTQTVLGTQEQLKNPSIKAIKQFYKEWYVPNNMAIALSGDFDPDRVVAIIEQYFGDLVPNNELSKLVFEPEKEIEKPIEREIVGQEAQMVALGFRFEGAGSENHLMLELLDLILNNGEAGIIDLNIMQKQRMLVAQTAILDMSDYTAFLMLGRPREGQSLERAKELLLEQIEVLKSGDFDSLLLQSAVNNYKLEQIQQLESYNSIANAYISSFTNGVSWGEQVAKVQRIAAITKEQLVEFAQQNFKDNYVVVYKREGKRDDSVVMGKPKITPIATNRDTSSLFLREIMESEVEPIHPKFIDFSSDIKKGEITKGLKVLYKQNEKNNLFSLDFIVDFGQNHNPLATLSANLFSYLSTPKYSAEQIKQLFYSMATTFTFSVGDDKSYISLSGLDENMDKSIELMEYILSNAVVSDVVVANLVQDVLNVRTINKSNQQACFLALRQYIMYGEEFVKSRSVPESVLTSAKAEQLLEIIKSLGGYTTELLYYGPREYNQLCEVVKSSYKMGDEPKTMPEDRAVGQVTSKDIVYLAPYDAAQIYLAGYSSRGDKFTPEREGINTLYNSYFGGGMNSVVFQEIREARALAYSASSSIAAQKKIGSPYVVSSFIATQNDKMGDAMVAFKEILINMPLSPDSFEIAKSTLLTRLRTSRVTKGGVLWSYITARNSGLDYDINSEIYRAIEQLTLEDVANYQKTYIKDNSWHYGVLGNAKLIDVKSLESYGVVKRLTLEDIFGY